MRTPNALALVIALLGFGHQVQARGALAEDEVTGYFFVDRWGQGVIANGVFVAPELAKEFQKAWRPVKVTIAARKFAGEGGVSSGSPIMITKVTKVEELPEPTIKLSLKLDEESVQFGQTTRLHVTVENTSEEPVNVNGGKRTLYLATTIHRQGKPIPGREGIGIMLSTHTDQLRATESTRLSARVGDLRMDAERPALMQQRDGQWEDVNNSNGDSDRWPLGAGPMKIPPGGSLKLEYTIGADWNVNEYEVQAVVDEWRGFSRHVEISRSPALQFNVVDQK